MSSTSCNPPKPIVDWGTGTAPTLKYNLPQGTTLTPLARIPLNIGTSLFDPDKTSIPTDNFWSNASRTPIDSLGRDIVTDILQNVNNSKFVKNIKAVTLAPANSSPDKPAIKITAGGHVNLQAKTATASHIKSKFVKLNPGEGDELPAIELGGKEMNVDYLVRAIKDGLMPVARQTISGSTRIHFVKQPITPVPRLYILEEYRINSYLGDYGAGRIVKTFTLLPGEKTTITMRTFKQITSKKSTSQNVLESVSEDVVDSLDTFIQDERQNASTSNTSSSESFNVDVSAGCDFGFASASVDVGYESSSSSDQSRTDALNSLSNAMDKHTSQSNSNREVNINSSTEDSSTEEQEETIVRNLENINYSRVLNFVFRQMQQEYICVTTLNNIKILYTNGYPESVRVVGIEKLHELLESVLLDSAIEDAYRQIINEYCKVRNYEGEMVPFLTHVEYTKDGCLTGSTPEEVDYWTAIGATDSFDFLGSPMNVPGVILEVKKRTLQTDSVICDALLGQMDALDCYNMKRQDADADKASTEAEIMELYKTMLESATGTDKIELAKIVGRLLSKCCDVSQSGCGCGAGSVDTTKTIDPVDTGSRT